MEALIPIDDTSEAEQVKEMTRYNAGSSHIRRTLRLPGAPPGPRQRGARREAILDAAWRLLEEQGVEGTTMDALCREAGLAKGTLYHYFPCRIELFNALRARFREELFERIERRGAGCAADDWIGRLHVTIETAFSEYLDKHMLRDVAFYKAGQSFQTLMADDRLTTHLRDSIAAGADAGIWSVDDADWTAAMLYYGIHAACDRVLLGNHAREQMLSLLLRSTQHLLGLLTDARSSPRSE